jgi:hypothetical protein
MPMSTSALQSASLQFAAATAHVLMRLPPSAWTRQQFLSRMQLAGHAPASPIRAPPLDDPFPPEPPPAPEPLPEPPRDPLLEPPLELPPPDGLDEVLPELTPPSPDPARPPPPPPSSPVPIPGAASSPALFGVLLHPPDARTTALHRSPSLTIFGTAHSRDTKLWPSLPKRATPSPSTSSTRCAG